MSHPAPAEQVADAHADAFLGQPAWTCAFNPERSATSLPR